MPVKVFVFLAVVALAACQASTSSAVLRQAQHDKGQGPADNTNGQRENAAGGNGGSHVISVVTTFSTLNSFVQGVGGARVRVRNLVPVGASPEDYQPAPQDIATLSNAQLVVENGLGIEVWLQHVIENASNPHVRVVVLSNGLPHIDHNPHLWMDPVLARVYVSKIRDQLSSMDPANAALYARNAVAYQRKLAQLQHDIAKKIDTIPPSHRAMIIFHNAFDYYNHRFGIRTVGVIELSPGQDPSPAYIAHLVDLARANNVRAVFSEPEYSPKLAQALARSAGIKIVTDLYDDSIGNKPQVADYISMLRYDTDVIVNSLR
ncbi:MAG TPA: metal ABC transporter substrate-binding protein [Candidatus Baltobacteraceae bacterium]|jgi:ABC-type Zn uptake system ZnuABC Zn-binding protein ZnuA|nr:metal ABC transporter substrate-binding protein [Candidatus Baltobacteraceae bacterium]